MSSSSDDIFICLLSNFRNNSFHAFGIFDLICMVVNVVLIDTLCQVCHFVVMPALTDTLCWVCHSVMTVVWTDTLCWVCHSVMTVVWTYILYIGYVIIL